MGLSYSCLNQNEEVTKMLKASQIGMSYLSSDENNHSMHATTLEEESSV